MVALISRFLGPLLRALAPLLAALSLAVASWIIGYLNGTSSTQARWETERLQQVVAVSEARAVAAAEVAAAGASVAAALDHQKDTHARIQKDLRAALAASELRAARLSRELVRLHDAAASGGEPAAGTAAASGGAPGAPEAPAEAAEPASCGDLLTTAVENYEIAHRNAVRLAEIQALWGRLRQQGAPGN